MTRATSATSPRRQPRQTLGLIQILVSLAALVTLAREYWLGIDAPHWSNLLLAAVFCCVAVSWLAWPDDSGLPSRFSARFGSAMMLFLAATFFIQFLHSV
ncbi:hypothetical protein [Sphingomonas alpina]|uniref:Uncharacterized protein n=1 Tax=Sphingomonas alpina TaxID=653931 RepID=A0A7H0LEK3_9SPHN|nr:hypothetical protein [Sphingomonas alpina]QNQ08106.1 hypothetical protein H3Z74_15160 [Sphingomonas alpina]